MPSLTTSTRRVADTVLADPERALGLSAGRLAQRSGTSIGSVVRFCHAIGFPGYQDFKDRLGAEARRGGFDIAAITAHGVRLGVAGEVLAHTLGSLSRTLTSLDLGSIQRTADVLRGARRILIPAAGPSQPVAMAFGMWLSWSGYAVSHPTDHHTQQAIADRLHPGDVCFAVSHSGTTEHTLQSVRIAQRQGAATLALTSFARAPLTTLCDTSVVAGAGADHYRTADMASRPVHHAVLEAVWALVQHPVPGPANHS